MLKTKNMNPIRTLSGVTPVAILTKSFPCPGKCIYCPTEKNVPKSYLSSEPAVARAISANYDPVKQIINRINVYKITGHPVEKIELIIITSNWITLPERYKQQFILSIYNTLNSLSNPKYKKTTELKKAQFANQKAKHKIVGISIETRPDTITKKEIEKLRELGITRVEMGVQSLDNKVLKEIKRGHSVSATIKATKLLKDSGFKVCYHLMPNLPSSNPDKDYQMIKKVFSDQNFRPDQLKIYPCVLTHGTKLEDLYKNNLWTPYDDKTMINLLSDIKSNLIPAYIRIMRLWRDIPCQEISAGSKFSHMRLLVKENLDKMNKKCLCIRCREIKDKPPSKNLMLDRINYQASSGKEIFLQYIDNQYNIYALARLRIPVSPFIKELKSSALIRELHVYGPSKPLKNFNSDKTYTQHKGLGKKLIHHCENIVKKETNLSKIAAISAVGVRNYYQKLGYRLEGTYMVKHLST